MPITRKTAPLSPEAYLEWEKANETKHEYLNGDVFAMVGVKDSHATVALNLASFLKNHLKGSPCRAYISDMKAQIAKANAFFYPDVMVTCDPRDIAFDYYKQHPLLIVEVLSESTAAFDRGAKFSVYRQIESLQEYVLIDPDQPSVDSFRKDNQGHWVLYPYGSGETVEFASVKAKIPLDDLYEGVAKMSGEPDTSVQ